VSAQQHYDVQPASPTAEARGRESPEGSSHVRGRRRRRIWRAVCQSAIEESVPTTFERVHIKKCHWLMAAVTLFVYLLVGCGAGPSSDSTPAPPTVTAASPPTIHSDGTLLAALGYLNGPIEQFSLPRTVRVTTKVDQPNNVVAVMSSPSPAVVASYLRRALPAAGFDITMDNPAANTMTFAGYGWSGSFTGHDQVSAVLLRPQ
jgi:hypothetical protein